MNVIKSRKNTNVKSFYLILHIILTIMYFNFGISYHQAIIKQVKIVIKRNELAPK